jgi:RNA polymerase sigma-70 factor (ECF subfamily)
MATGKITALLRAWIDGDAGALDRLVSLVYKDLHRVAAARLRARPFQSLSPSDIVQDTFVRVLGQEARFVNTGHFFAVAGEMMRRVLVDHARARHARKRGGGGVRVALSDVELAEDPKGVDFLALDELLAELAAQDPERARVVKLHFFSGLTFEEIAKELEISPSAAKRGWESTRLWLLWRLRGGDSPAAAP